MDFSATTGKPITCKAAVIWEFNKDVAIETIEVAPPGEDEVRVKIIATGLCHSDLHILDGNFKAQPLPLVMGHEGAGIVESVGSKVKSVKPGDKVFTLFIPQCRNCKACKSKRNNCCADIGKVPSKGTLGRTTGTDGTTRFTCKGKPIFHFIGCSAMSEYTVIPETSCVLVNPKTPLEIGCILACGFSTGYGSSANCVDIQKGETTAVWGMGGVGLATAVGCKEKGASIIVGIGASNSKEEIARKMGVTDFIALKALKKPLKDTLMEITNNVGYDYTFVCIGDIEAMETAVAVTALGGTMVIVGLSADNEVMKVSPGFMLGSRSVLGSCIGDYKVRDDLPKLVDRYLDGKLPLKEFISHNYKLDQLNEAIAVMKSGKSLRSVINFV